ncbi:MAG TPA: GNAT family N-acetyltransferase [Nitrososphaerales archaeon]|nr:GNAT family N-acetyltransferase [Nitrososphaerales archaeon]
MTHPVLEMVNVPKEGRARLLPILEESFEGMYLWHARRTLQGIELVRVARSPEGEDAGLAMLKVLAEGAGYVYYIAVPLRFRRQGIGGMLLDDALAQFAKRGVVEVYASVGEENAESKALFASRRFERLKGSDMSEKYGRIRALLMYREMMVVPGEMLLGRRLEATQNGL